MYVVLSIPQIRKWRNTLPLECDSNEQQYANENILVDFDTFSRILNRPGGFRDLDDPENYCRGFQVFDKDMTGFIGVGQLRYILTNLGEKMSDEEVDELLKAVDTSSGEINYMGMFWSFASCCSVACNMNADYFFTCRPR